MFVLTRLFENPPSFENRYYLIGLLTDNQRKQTFLYCASIRSGSVAHPSSAIFRLNINECSNDWEFVGIVDFICEYNTISPCGQYFWSIELSLYIARTTQQQSIVLRQVNPKTLKYEVFQNPDTGILGSFLSACFYYTRHFGIILLLRRGIDEDGHYETSDVIFRFRLSEEQKCIQLKKILLPDIPTVRPYLTSRCYRSRYKASSFGLIEKGYSLFFYQIDYFGDVFVLEWNESGTLEWIQFTVEGDKFESFLSLENRDLSTHENNSDIQAWSASIHGCKRIFSTLQVCSFFFCDVISAKDPYNGAQMFFIKKGISRGEYCWEQVVVGQIPTLLHLAYLTACRVIRRNDELVDVVSSIDKKPPKKSRILSRIMQTIRRFRNKEEVPPIISIRRVYKRGSEPNHMQRRKCKATVIELLDELKNKLI